jgi:probable nitrogen fixation protein
LIVINKHLREVHRFGFESLQALESKGEQLVSEGIEWIEKYPDVARY